MNLAKPINKAVAVVKRNPQIALVIGAAVAPKLFGKLLTAYVASKGLDDA